MELSRQLMKQFADITKTPATSSGEATVYGTVLEVSEVVGTDGLLPAVVQIDGSTERTPVTSAVGIAVGNRVIVRLKDHTATIVNNVQDPSVSTTEVKYIVSRMEDDEGNLAELIQTAEQLTSRIEDTEGNVSELYQTATEISSKVEDAEGNISQVSQKVDSIKFEVRQSSGSDGQVYSSLELTVGDATYTGLILMEGNLNVSGQISADALYAALGDIADLTVDRLSTSRRIVKYLAQDITDDNYILAEDERLAFISGVYADGVEQAKTPEGIPIYWESNPHESGVVLGADGYPFKDGVRIFTTTGITDWPVMVYKYVEDVKGKIAFELEEGVYVPVFTLGAGDENGNNIIRMAKKVEGFEMMYAPTKGDDIGIKMSRTGYMDLYGLRQLEAISVVEEADGSVTITQTMSGGVAGTMSISVDENGDPVSLTRIDGVVVPITWEAK